MVIRKENDCWCVCFGCFMGDDGYVELVLFEIEKVIFDSFDCNDRCWLYVGFGSLVFRSDSEFGLLIGYFI